MKHSERQPSPPELKRQIRQLQRELVQLQCSDEQAWKGRQRRMLSIIKKLRGQLKQTMQPNIYC